MAASFLAELAQHRCLLFLIVILGFGGNLLVGFQVSVIAYPSQDVQAFLNASWVRRFGAPLSPETLTLLWSFVVSVFCLGGLCGNLGSGALLHQCGKKKALLWSDLLVILGAVLIGFSQMADSGEMLLAGRFCYGVSAGICMNTIGPYLAESSPQRLRGFAITASVVFFSLGKVLGQVMGLREVLGGPSRWPLLLSLNGGPALAQLLLLPLFPETPPHLLLQNGDKEACLRAMRTLWGPNCGHRHEAQVEEILREAEADAADGKRKWGALEVLRAPALRRPLALALLLVLGLQLCGLSAIYFYAFDVFRTARIQEGLIPFVTLGTGACEFLASILCSTIIDRFGRRILLWGGFLMMGLSMALLILALFFQDRLPWLSYFCIAFIFLFVVFYAVGPAGATFAFMMEIFGRAVRPPALVILGTILWFGLFLSGMGFPVLVESMGYFCFLIFLAVDAGIAAFVYFFFPETKGRSITEITNELQGINLRGKRAPGGSLCTKL
nr:solute carrier family 2, facilitated glucose transporter member 11-like [Anolis sagrei ordinatus]